ncbi:MAG: aldolase/citrate lyase family protein [Oscillospiraceae bacterium]
MAIKLMYITNRPEVARIAEAAGVDRIFVDMEYIGKKARQGGMDTVQSYHTVEDIRRIRSVVHTSDVLVRVNPIHEASAYYGSSREEIDAAIDAGADILMLPYFKTADEVRAFVELVNGRVRTLPLVETPEAAGAIDEILKIEGIDEIFIGLNDLSLGYGEKFLFEPLADGTVERLCLKFRLSGIPYGFGGIASLGKGLLPSEYIIKEHYRLGSTCAILSRSFCNVNKITDLSRIESIFANGIREIRNLEQECQRHCAYFTDNQRLVVEKVQTICENIQQ